MKSKQTKYEKVIEPNLDKILEMIRQGNTEENVYRALNISRPTWISYKKEHQDFAKQIELAKENFKTELICQAYKQARGYQVKITKQYFTVNATGQKVQIKELVETREVRGDPGMVQFLLINRFPDEFQKDPSKVADDKEEEEGI